MTGPLSASTYLRRNLGKTIPLVGVIVLAVLLVAAIISLINSIPYSIKTIYSYSREMLGVGPRGDASMTPKIVERLKNESPIEISNIMVCRAAPSQVRSIVGKWPFAVLGFERDDMQTYLDRMKVTSLEGRLPEPGMPEAVVSEPVARNLGLKLGGVLLGPELSESYSPKHVKVVGIAQTKYWLMLGSVEYMRQYHFPPVDVAVVFAKDPAQQDQLDRWANKAFEGDRAQVFAYFLLEKSTNEMFVTLYKILNVVIGILVLVITLMMGMLINIYLGQRLIEFGLLQALGYTRRGLLRRVLKEALAFVVMGWVLGVLAAYSLLWFAKKQLMDPNAFALNPLDLTAYLYTVAPPVAVLIVAWVTVYLRFRNFDPVGVVERRLV